MARCLLGQFAVLVYVRAGKGGEVRGYRELAEKAAGHALKLRVGAGAVVPAPPPPSPAEVARQRLRQEAEREPAVQEALDLFDGRVVDVREAKP